MAAGDPSDKSTWTTFWVKIWQGNAVDLKDGEALEYIKGNTPPLRDIFQSAIDWTPEGSYVRISEMKYWIPTQWDNHGGRVTLAGDAAHPMLICKCIPVVALQPLTNIGPKKKQTAVKAFSIQSQMLPVTSTH